MFKSISGVVERFRGFRAADVRIQCKFTRSVLVSINKQNHLHFKMYNEKISF